MGYLPRIDQRTTTWTRPNTDGYKLDVDANLGTNEVEAIIKVAQVCPMAALAKALPDVESIGLPHALQWFIYV